jgi:quercetin dioxygenase-like cupin family protein
MIPESHEEKQHARRNVMETVADHRTETLWVLGHRIRPWDTHGSYGLIEVASPPNVPGPPPHYHKSEREFFLIMKGTLEVMTNGEWESMSAGSFVELPPNTVHTFINKGSEDVVWITGWRPKGFERFFRDFGIPTGEEAAREKSVSEKVVQRVIQTCESYGMCLKM